ncbi:MAG TPA: hypothetical protein VNN72_01300, partial [Polyangiaceae bacterium]|nr:hypothetical protein [Polyangiaceae bacterium]
FRQQQVLQQSRGVMQHDVAKLLFGRIAQAQQARLMSLEHFSVDGTPLRLRNDPYGAADHPARVGHVRPDWSPIHGRGQHLPAKLARG